MFFYLTDAETLFRVFPKDAFDEVLELCRQLDTAVNLIPKACKVFALFAFAESFEARIFAYCSTEWFSCSTHEEEGPSEREDVHWDAVIKRIRLLVLLSIASLLRLTPVEKFEELGSHPRRCAHDSLDEASRMVPIELGSEAKVDDFWTKLLVHDNVLFFQVPVTEAHRMGVLETAQ